MWRAMRQRGGTARLYQLSESTESTQKSCRLAVFELVVDGVDHAAVFKLEEAAAGGGKDEGGQACVAEDEHLHVAPEGWGEPFVVFAFHRLPSASLMQSYFTGAVVYRIGTTHPIFFRASVRTVGARVDLCQFRRRVRVREHIADELDANPRYSVQQFHSEILPDDRAGLGLSAPAVSGAGGAALPCLLPAGWAESLRWADLVHCGPDLECAYDCGPADRSRVRLSR